MKNSVLVATTAVSTTALLFVIVASNMFVKRKKWYLDQVERFGAGFRSHNLYQN